MASRLGRLFPRTKTTSNTAAIVSARPGTQGYPKARYGRRRSGSRQRSTNNAGPHGKKSQAFRNAEAVYKVSKPPRLATTIAAAALSHMPASGTPARVTYVPEDTKSPSRPMPKRMRGANNMHTLRTLSVATNASTATATRADGPYTLASASAAASFEAANSAGASTSRG